ncbi:MAG: VWA domain-containing protein, partial [Blastocatellia bacterium]|nr:VWA domain-containing protein [Blastocatellia bacterium]
TFALMAVFALAPAKASQDEQVLKLRTDLVVVDVTVMDKDGRFIRDLKAKDFILYEDDKPQKLEFFNANEEAALTRPISAVFAIDNSGSITPEEVNKQREATESFMRLVRADSVFAVVSFNHQVKVVQDFTSDPRKITEAFRRIKKPEGSTMLFRSIDKAVSMLKRGPRFRNGRRLRRVVIAISDGIDSVDPPMEQSHLIQRANDAEVTVYSITLPSYSAGSLTRERSLTLLDVARIVPMTGGKDFSADAKDFTPAFKAIAEEIRSSYTLAYYPAEASRNDARVHRLRVEVDRVGAIPRASRSTYQSPQPGNSNR